MKHSAPLLSSALTGGPHIPFRWPSTFACTSAPLHPHSCLSFAAHTQPSSTTRPRDARGIQRLQAAQPHDRRLPPICLRLPRPPPPLKPYTQNLAVAASPAIPLPSRARPTPHPGPVYLRLRSLVVATVEDY
uniref:Uncharacterized protein n=1 Tax=Arundo donax TaxID=35708 RepID=A0A0A9G972_ARUDO